MRYPRLGLFSQVGMRGVQVSTGTEAPRDGAGCLILRMVVSVNNSLWVTSGKSAGVSTPQERG